MIKKIFKSFLAVIAGLFITLLFLELFLRCLGWYQNNRSLFIKVDVKSKNEIRILSLGESMTASGQNPYYPEQLQNILNKSLPNKKIIVFNEAVPGSTSKDILQQLEEKLGRDRPDLVTIMTGVNDSGYVKYEKFANIKNSDFFYNFKIYKLMQFLFMNIKNKILRISKSIQDDLIKIVIAEGQDEDDLILKGDNFREKGQIDLAKVYYKKALSVNPDSYKAYIKLGELWENTTGSVAEYNNYIDQKVWYYQQAIKIDPQNDEPYYNLVKLYDFLKMREKRLEILNQGLQANPNSYNLLMVLAKDKFKENNISEAITTINRAFTSAQSPQLEDIRLLAVLYKSQGKPKEAERVLSMLADSSDGLAQDYMKIADILKKKGIVLVAVQYPMRDISPLKTMLKGTDALFVDNEKSFKEQLAKYGPDKFFVDRFAGDFGHLTTEGHRIVAENIASALLKEVFRVKK